MTPRPAGPWTAVAVLGVVVAVGTPVAWAVSRPSSSTGAPVVAAAPPTGSSTPAASTGPGVARRGPIPVQAARPGSTTATPPPVRIRIRDLGVDAAVDPVGVDGRGAMALPDDVRRVGWYRFNPAPGAASGTVVLSGHVDDARQGRGALFELRFLEVGAMIDVADARGVLRTYRVTGRQTFTKQRLPTERLFARDGPPRLLVITCGGPFQPELRSYRDNVVVAAEPVTGGSP